MIPITGIIMARKKYLLGLDCPFFDSTTPLLCGYENSESCFLP